MNRLRKFTPVILATVLVFSVALIFSPDVLASSLSDGVNAARADGAPSELFGSTGVITTVTNILLFIVGALSVIMLIIGGLRYVVSGGNSSAVTAAKNTILYAIVGLVISFLAFAAINFVINTLAPGAGGSAGGTDV
jgi:type IV secretion system pilin